MSVDHDREVETLEVALGVSFRQPDLLRLALTHSSYVNEHPGTLSESNERLEFLGDAVLGAVIAQELYRLHPAWPEGELTQARSDLVQGDSLARLAKGLGLGGHLYMGRGEDAGGGRERPTNLAAAFEALVAALFVDQGYEAARVLILRVFAHELSAENQRAAAKNPKSALQEAVQGMGQPAPSYEIVEVKGEGHAPRFTAEVTVAGRMVGRGTGSRKSQAEQAAAVAALAALGDEG